MQNFNKAEKSTYLMYLDANNLYGYSMQMHLPVSDFEWCEEEFTEERIKDLADDASIGYIFEVDLEYPDSLHDLHKDYPFCAENTFVPGTNVRKLLLTLCDKKNYVIHYKMLKLALENGLVLKKIHRILQFKQAPWLKAYIDLNTRLRTQATNEFEKNFFKLMINAVFGKTMENLRLRVDIRLSSLWEGRYGANRLIAMPHFKRCKIFNENFVAIEMRKTHIEMRKPIVVGMAILDMSKVVMYDFFYNQLKPQYGAKVTLGYTDTDSFILEVATEDFYADMKKNITLYDTSNYKEDNVFGMPLRGKKVPGLFKDEQNGHIVSEFVGLRSKMYAIRTVADKTIKRAKGVKKCVLSKKLRFQDYVACVKTNCVVVEVQSSIRSKNHMVYTIKQRKVALSGKDDKRHILPNKIDTLPWGHYSVTEA